uniref:Xyloglucan endo-transglycosylase C-terminal domain-containing protein n=1 Tax=Ananas comosus var. bracteatus TaxID=296719 RepID=A0A6V7QK05_ANACO|nr:unnamed protein product [Ananas comosus var. bracteatus]
MVVHRPDPDQSLQKLRERRPPVPHQPADEDVPSLWNADDWACQGGRVKTDWSKAPFVAKYRNLKLDVCECESADSISQCYSSSNWYNGWQYSKLTAAQLGQMNWVQQNYKIYDYCTDYKRFNGQMPSNALCRNTDDGLRKLRNLQFLQCYLHR